MCDHGSMISLSTSLLIDLELGSHFSLFAKSQVWESLFSPENFHDTFRIESEADIGS